LTLGLSLPLLALPGFDDFLAYGADPNPSLGKPMIVPVTLFWLDSSLSSSDIGMGVWVRKRTTRPTALSSSE
jgi:hypothetical protein